VHIQPIIDDIRSTVTAHGAFASDEPAVDAAVAHLLDALGPALRQAAVELAQQAATEVQAQLPDRTIDVVLTDGDPMLRVGEAPDDTDQAAEAEDFDARITLRLPPRLKHLIEDAAESSGDSVNAFVVDALSKRARRQGTTRGGRVNQSFDL
jgi:hypothetical protein